MATKRYDRPLRHEIPDQMQRCDYCGRWQMPEGDCGHCGNTAELDVKYEAWTKVPYRAPARRIER